MSFIFSPSILSADFSNLGDAVETLDKSSADWIHIDVMDGNFVPNISFGLPVIRDIRPLSNKPFDVHLMISNPDKYIQAFKDAGADILTVHYEGSVHLHRLLSSVREAGMKAGLALNPHTPASVVEQVAGLTDVVLVMSVNPGFGGQKFIAHTYEKIKALKEIRRAAGAAFVIEVDGGVNTENTAALLEAGADALVAGSAVFNTPDIQETVKKFKAIKPVREV